MFSIKTQIILWLVAALVVVPLIEILGLNNPRGADKDLPPDKLEQVWRNRLRQAFEFLAMIGGALGVIYLMHRGVRRDEPSIVGDVMVTMLWTIGFIVATVVIALIAHFLSGSTRTKYHIGLYALFVFGFVLPLSYDTFRGNSVAERRASLVAKYIDTQKQLRLQWREDIDAAGAHGGVGVIPPMLQVLDSGEGVQVTNIGDEPLCLDLRRSHARLGAGLEDQCALTSELGGVHVCVEIAPGKSEWLRVSSKRPDLPDCSGEPLEFRVGNWHSQNIGWWSDVALADFDRRTTRIDTEPGFHEPSFDEPMLDDTEFRPNDYIYRGLHYYQTWVVGPPRVAQWRAQLKAVEEKRAALLVSPDELAAQARQLNLLRKAQRWLRDVQGLRERLAGSPDHVRHFADHLPVQDNLDRATVSHPYSAVAYVQLSRVGRDSNGKEFTCEMRGLSRGTALGTYVSKHQPGEFELASRAGLCADPANSTLQMVVYEGDGQLIYASPRALDRMEAEAKARVQALEPGTVLPE